MNKRAQPPPASRVAAQVELEARIVRGLAAQWEEELWVLPAEYTDVLKPPQFCLRDLEKTWGYWSADRREMAISRRLVLDYPWHCVRDVLRHETAHQFVSEVWGDADETAHGPMFQRACRLLRADPAATGLYDPLEHRLGRRAQNSDDKILARVKKLFALAQSPNRHEAEAAMAKAHECIAKYNVDLLAHSHDRDFVAVCVGKAALRRPRYEYNLAQLLREFYFVRTIWLPTYVLEKGKMGSALELTGTPENVKMASYVYDFVHNFIDQQWRQYNRDKGHRHHRKVDFAIGIAEGFHAKLESQMRGTDGEGGAAVVHVADPKLTEYYRHMYPRTTTVRPGAKTVHATVLNDGRSVGAKMVVAKGIESNAGERGRLLGR